VNTNLQTTNGDAALGAVKEESLGVVLPSGRTVVRWALRTKHALMT
jgi:hypothetical protein